LETLKEYRERAIRTKMIIEDQRAELDALAGQNDPVTGTRRALIQAQYYLGIATASGA